MSQVQVRAVRIEDMLVHPNADRLSIAMVNGFPCVCGKDQFSKGDIVLYFPVDIVLPPELVEKLFKDSKIKPSKGRIRAIKIRGAYSEGLLVPWNKLLSHEPSLERDLTNTLDCKKYEPPEPVHLDGNNKAPKSKRSKRLLLPRYTDTNRGEGLFDKVFADPHETVVVTAKLHGTSARYGWVDVVGKSWWYRLYLWFVRTILKKPVRSFVVGTRNVDRTIDENTVYAQIAKTHHLDKLAFGEVVFGEIVGHGIQNGFNYGCKPGQIKFYAYFVTVNGKPLNYYDFQDFCHERGIDTVPLIFIGRASEVRPNLSKWFKDRVTHLEDDIPCREGVVVAPLSERRDGMCGSRTVLKFINPEYLLLKDPGDNH